MTKLFFELIQISIGCRVCLSRTPCEAEWGELYAMAKKQSLVGVCFAGVQKLVEQRQEPPEMLYLTWMGMAAKIQQRNETVNRQCVKLQARLSADGFRSCVLKGQAIAALYQCGGFNGLQKVSEDSIDSSGTPTINLQILRQSGDIDVWLDGSHERIMEYVNRVSPTNEVRWLHTQMSVFPDTEVEVHFRPSYLECPWQDKALQKFFGSEKDACFSSGRCTDSFNQVFILAHVFRHMFSEGVGLRQLMDYYFVLKNSKERMSREEFAAVMKATGMYRFAKAVMWIMQEVFGLEEKYLLCATSDKDGRFLLDEVMQSGNFGHQDERVKHMADESAFHRFWRIALYNCRVIRFSPWIVVCSPFWRLWHWSWRKRKGYK